MESLWVLAYDLSWEIRTQACLFFFFFLKCSDALWRVHPLTQSLWSSYRLASKCGSHMNFQGTCFSWLFIAVTPWLIVMPLHAMGYPHPRSYGKTQLWAHFQGHHQTNSQIPSLWVLLLGPSWNHSVSARAQLGDGNHTVISSGKI